jgi:ABC-type glycerol-3-phosphate transport system substrate-binding protein
MIFKRRRQRACQQARLWLTQRAEDGLADKTAARLETHLADCPACRDWSRRADYLDGRLLAEQPAYHRLTPADAAHIRSRIHQGIWRKSIMLQTRQALQGAATLIVLAALTAVFIFWQRQTVQPLLDATPTAGPVGRATLTLAVPDGASERYRALAEAFMAGNEGVTIHVESMNRLIGNDPNPARALAQSTDIFPAAYAFASDWQSLALDLTPFTSSADFDANDFPAGLVYAADGTIRHLPVGIDVTFIAYNKALFDNAGLAYPMPEWTWEEFVSLAAQLTQRYGDFTAQYGWADGLKVHGLLGLNLIHPLVDYSTTPPTLQLADEEVTAAISRYLGLFGEGGIAPTPGSTFSATAEMQTLIQERRVAMWLASVSNLPEYGNLDIAVLPLPIIDNPAERRLYLSGQGFAVSAATQHPQTAWRLLEYLSRQPGFDENAMPARASVRQATAYWDGVEPEIIALVEEYLDRSFTFPNPVMRQVLERAVVAALIDEVEPSESLRDGEVVLQRALAGETEPLAMVAGDAVATTAAATGQILFVSDTMHLHRHRALAEAFEAENPDLRIEVSWPQWTHFSGYGFPTMGRATDGRRADCFIYGPLRTEAHLDRVLPLDALLELEPDLNRDDFYSIALTPFLYDGALVALPNQLRLPLIGYDPVLFDAAGIPYPEPGWTLEEFLETAVALTTGEGPQKQYGYVPNQGDYSDAWLFLHAFGVDLLDRSMDPPMANFDTPVVAEALRWYVALSETYGVKPIYRTNAYDYANLQSFLGYLSERRSLFAARRGAMWWDDGTESEGPYATPTAAIEERQYTTFPIYPGAEIALPAEVTGLFISAETEQRQACWQWLTFLMAYDPGIGIPARRSIAHSEEFQLRAGPAAKVMLQNVAQMSEQRISLSSDWYLLGWYSIALTRVLEEGITPEAALAITRTEFEAFRHCVIERDLFAPGDLRQRVFECEDPASPYIIFAEE